MPWVRNTVQTYPRQGVYMRLRRRISMHTGLQQYNNNVHVFAALVNQRIMYVFRPWNPMKRGQFPVFSPLKQEFRFRTRRARRQSVNTDTSVTAQNVHIAPERMRNSIFVFVRWQFGTTETVRVSPLMITDKYTMKISGEHFNCLCTGSIGEITSIFIFFMIYTLRVEWKYFLLILIFKSSLNINFTSN